MTRILKKDDKADAQAIRALRSAWSTTKDGGPAKDERARAPAAPAIDPELLRLREDQAQAQLRLEQQEAEIADLHKQIDAAFRKGEAQGREAGIRDAADQSAKLLARVEGGVERAMAMYTQVLSGLERLAPALARQGLAQLLGDADSRADLVTAIVLKQIKTIEAQSVLHIEVSAADFGDEAALSGLSEALGAHAVKVQAYSALKSGDCRIKLKLGALEVGLDQQWGRLNAMLKDLSEPTGGAA